MTYREGINFTSIPFHRSKIKRELIFYLKKIMRGVNNTTETINAAATAIVSADNRVTQSPSVQKKRWGLCWSISSCFARNQNKKIRHAVLVPEPNASRTDPPRLENQTQPPPFTAPPSSPASFLQSEPPFAAQSPGGFTPFASTSATMYSPAGPTNIFAAGPYAHEPQLVSPPVFSTYTTEPSTAPVTPRPGSVHLTTPSSPEVPFARLLDSSSSNENGWKFSSSHSEFQSYQLYPGSPMGHLISPSSVVSNSGNMTPDAVGPTCPDGFLFNRQNSDVGPHLMSRSSGVLNSGNLTPNDVGPMSYDSFSIDSRNSNVGLFIRLVDHRVSFEITPEEVVRRVEKRRSADAASGGGCHPGDVADRDTSKNQKHRSTATLESIKDFNFDSRDGADGDWMEDGSIKNGSIFPIMQPGVGPKILENQDYHDMIIISDLIN